jgi:hypothetical protein
VEPDYDGVELGAWMKMVLAGRTCSVGVLQEHAESTVGFSAKIDELPAKAQLRLVDWPIFGKAMMEGRSWGAGKGTRHSSLRVMPD